MEVDGQRLDNDNVSKLCEPCQEGNMSTQADGYCNDCEEYICQTCFQNHVNMKLGRNHVLGTVDAGLKQGTLFQVEKCKKHTTEVIKYYCRNHDYVGCGDCIVSNHKKCDTEFIRDLAKNFEESSDFKNIVKEVDNLEELKTEIEVSLEKYRKDNTEFHDKAIQEIQENRAKINTWIENVTSKVEAEEMEIWKENEIVLSKLGDWIKIISDMINKVRDDISIEKYKGENLFIRVIECKSELSEFAIKCVPEIKSSLEIQSFTFESNQSLLVLTKSANLGVIKIVGRNASSNLSTGPEAEYVTTGEWGTVKSSEDPVHAELEKELKQIRQTTMVEKETHERLQQSYNSLKKDFEDQLSLLSRERVQSIREREQSIIVTEDREQMIIRLQQEINSLKSQLDSRIKENEILVSTSKARQEQDQNTIQSLQSKLKKISENHEEEHETQSSQIRDRQRQTESAQKSYQLPDPRAAGFDVGKRVKSTIGRFEDHMRVELEKELERILETTILEKEQRENLEKTIVVLKQENCSLNDLNISLKSQLDSCKKEFETLQSSSKARQEQDNTKIQSLQSDLKKISESHEKERESLSSQIRDLQRQTEPAQKTYQLPDPRAAGFDVGKKVKHITFGRTGTVTAVYPSGYVDVKWDNGRVSVSCKAGAGGQYYVKLL